MADSFFGFDTTQSAEDDGGGGLGEDVYDALNDLTFGSAINGDWEDIHENLVLLDNNGNTNGKSKDETDDGDIGDLDFNLARVGLEDCEEVDDDNEGRVQLDPSVWAHPFKYNDNHGVPNIFSNALRTPNADVFIRQNFPNPFQAQQQIHMQIQQHQQQQQPMQMPNVPPKIMSVEDIERTIRNQQIQQNTEQRAKQSTPQHQRQMQQQQQQELHFQHSLGQLTLNQGKNLMFSQQAQQLHSNIGNMQQKQGSQRVPPGFPINMLPPHVNPQAPQIHPNLARMQPNLPLPLNNYALHPNFNGMRSGTPPPLPIQHMHQQLQKRAGQQLQLPPHMQQLPQFQVNPQSMQQSVNQFNKRLVHEIQQNHPMLPFNRMNNNHLLNNNMGQHPQTLHQNMHHQMQNQHQHRSNNNNNQHQQQNRGLNGNLDQDDEYANLMSNRDKQWLIGIQLSQLNTGTPYIDDFYYTVFKERKAKLKGIKENKAHKDNQMNHPLTQPKGHAHLVLISMGNKNGGNQQRNNQRERKNSESNKEKDTPRTYTPLQFENSLGKLQCGSVTAPRKIIDMDVVGTDTGNPLNTSIEISAQRKSKQILIHIETLYRIALKLEDLENPTAIATALLIKDRKDKERLLALEQERLNAGNVQESVSKVDTISTLIRSSLSAGEKEENREDLIAKVLAGLTAEKIGQMMTVRKGKTLVKRILPLIKDNVFRWDVWCAIFSALPNLLKKDKDDAEGLLFALFSEFEAHIQNASIDAILRLTNTLIINDKIAYVFTNKFSISCIIVLILKVEKVYVISSNAVNSRQQMAWVQFLTALVNAVSKNNTQLVNVTFENDIVKPLENHFSRFRELRSQPLITVLTQNISTN